MAGKQLPIRVEPQPDEQSCGPTCLHGVYRYFGDEASLDQLLAEVPRLDTGGTLAVMLACHALRRGYAATLYSFNLALLDPSWFPPQAPVDISAKLIEQARVKNDPKLQLAARAYRRFLELGGELRMEDLTNELITGYLDRDRPLLVGVSATYLYRQARELIDGTADDVAGLPQGHFVVLCGHHESSVDIADPWRPDRRHPERYAVAADRLVTAILLGVFTYDGNLLVIEPRSEEAR
jgi:hypothetical protein